MRRLVLQQHYVVTLHADDEMDADGLTISDLERVVLTGEIVERQWDAATVEFKYKVRGETVDGSEAEVIAKISVTGKVVFITVYAI